MHIFFVQKKYVCICLEIGLRKKRHLHLKILGITSSYAFVDLHNLVPARGAYIIFFGEYDEHLLKISAKLYYLIFFSEDSVVRIRVG